MRLLAFAGLLALAACESERILPVDVLWMDWPAEVAANESFRTRLVVSQPCAVIRSFAPSPTSDASAVTFAPYFVAGNDVIYCGTDPVVSEVFVFGSLDTAGIAPGLFAPSDRTYEMRAAGGFSCPACNTAPWTTFGLISVRPTPLPPSAVRNAAGQAIFQRDSLGCTRIRPSGSYGPGAAIVVENPPDSTEQFSGFVRGYIHEPAAPVCGEARAFHFVGRY